MSKWQWVFIDFLQHEIFIRRIQAGARMIATACISVCVTGHTGVLISADCQRFFPKKTLAKFIFTLNLFSPESRFSPDAFHPKVMSCPVMSCHVIFHRTVQCHIVFTGSSETFCRGLPQSVLMFCDPLLLDWWHVSSCNMASTWNMRKIAASH